jgi:hypothetical protein
MMKLLSFLTRLSMGILLFSSPLLAQYQAPCGTSYHYDSYGLGMHHGFLGKDLGADGRMWFNPQCLQWGINEGARLKKAYCGKNPCQESSCYEKFKSGYNEGFKATGKILSEECSHQGYSAGRADLDYGAREGNKDLVGNECVKQYRQGVSDGKNLLAGNPPSDQPQRSCYELGKFEYSYYK